MAPTYDFEETHIGKICEGIWKILDFIFDETRTNNKTFTGLLLMIKYLLTFCLIVFLVGLIFYGLWTGFGYIRIIILVWILLELAKYIGWKNKN